MTKTEIENKIKELEEKQAELQKQLDELKQIKVEETSMEWWKPKMGEEYWYINDDGDIECDVWEDSSYDEWRYLTNNIFKTEQEAEIKKELNL